MFKFCLVRVEEPNIESPVEIIRSGRGKTKPPTVKLPRIYNESNDVMLDHGQDFENVLIAFAQIFNREADL